MTEKTSKAFATVAGPCLGYAGTAASLSARALCCISHLRATLIGAEPSAQHRLNKTGMVLLHATSCRIAPKCLAIACLLVFSLASSLLFILTVEYPPSTLVDPDFEHAALHDAAPGWRRFAPDPAPVLVRPAPRTTLQTLTQTLLPPACADLWIARGELCAALLARGPDDGADTLRLSVVHTWVNGSDAPLRRARGVAHMEGSTNAGTAQRHFTAHDELLYSLRSVMAALPAAAVAGLHVVSTDLPLPDGTRAGQVPTWLAPQDGCAPRLEMHHHWDLFKMRTNGTGDEEEARAWRERALPSFNSMAIETQLVSLAPRLSQTIIYLTHPSQLNDDFFLARPLSLTDFASPLFGPVFRLQSSLLVASAVPARAPDAEGEWPSLKYANQLLDARFGVRRRPYVAHFAKAYDKGILSELAQVWPVELTEGAGVRFRGGAVPGLAFLVTHFVVERHREALLWAFLVARHSPSPSRHYTPAERHAILAELGYTPSTPPSTHPTLLAPKPARAPLPPHAALALAHFDAPQATEYTFTSQGGYAYARLEGRVRWEGGAPVWVAAPTRWAPERNWPQFADVPEHEAGAGAGEGKGEWEEKGKEEGEGEIECALDIRECFGPGWVDDGEAAGVDAVFRRVAFEEPRCGDCVVTLLLGRSGPRGLGAFLPDAGAGGGDGEGEVEVLSRAKSWEEAEYAVDGDRSRARAVSLLTRYSYVLGDSPAELITYTSARHLRARMRRLMPAVGRREKAFLVLNDDTGERVGAREVQAIDGVLRQHMHGLWPEPVGGFV
ncbi:hypothetical protein HWV62_30941 [Athelia sp. TMB]|nr:hypothetical protein HWV62_30941 [Athelia sp. TMB]